MTGGFNMLTGGAVVPTDPYYSSVSLLAHMDGTNGATIFTDNSPNTKTITNTNISGSSDPSNVTVNTSIYQFATGSAYFPNGQHYLDCGYSTDFELGTGDFTIEGWFRLTSVAGGYSTIIATTRDNNYSVSGVWNITVNVDQSISFSVYPGINMISNPGVINGNTWYSFSVTRSGNTFRLFLNGILLSSTTNNSSLSVDQTLKIGTLFLNGTYALVQSYVDEIRITKGVARYTSDYTPSNTAFPNS